MFAWLPVYINKPRKTVWLEWVRVEEKYGWAGFTKPRLVWHAMREV
jgi:hypothetical protein